MVLVRKTSALQYSNGDSAKSLLISLSEWYVAVSKSSLVSRTLTAKVTPWHHLCGVVLKARYVQRDCCFSGLSIHNTVTHGRFCDFDFYIAIDAWVWEWHRGPVVIQIYLPRYLLSKHWSHLFCGVSRSRRVREVSRLISSGQPQFCSGWSLSVQSLPPWKLPVLSPWLIHTKDL